MILGHRQIEENSGHREGRRLLQELYEEQGLGPMPPILISPMGKPYFQGNPLYFSITHTKHHVFCALSPVPVGIDGEEQDRKVNLRLADKILSPGEKERFDASKDKRRALLRLWVQKEAGLKLAGTGLQGYPCHTDYDPEDARVQECYGCYLAVFTAPAVPDHP